MDSMKQRTTLSLIATLCSLSLWVILLPEAHTLRESLGLSTISYLSVVLMGLCIVLLISSVKKSSTEPSTQTDLSTLKGSVEHLIFNGLNQQERERVLYSLAQACMRDKTSLMMSADGRSSVRCLMLHLETLGWQRDGWKDRT